VKQRQKEQKEFNFLLEMPYYQGVTTEENMKRIRFIETALKTRKASNVPGDQTLVLTRPAVDATGREWPRGTKLVPLCGGTYDGARYQDLTVVG
jgi:hypothetical protein